MNKCCFDGPEEDPRLLSFGSLADLIPSRETFPDRTGTVSSLRFLERGPTRGVTLVRGLREGRPCDSVSFPGRR